MTPRHAGRRVLVTGSSRGIGLEIAAAFVEAGASVVLNGRNPVRLREARTQLEDRFSPAPGTLHEAVFDVTDPESVSTAVETAVRISGPIEVLVNNAGTQLRAPLLELSLEDWHHVLDTNLTGAFLVARAVAPAMIAAGAGRILNVCSVQTSLVRPTTAPYAASKAGLAGLTRAMCAEWAPLGLQVNGVAPGYLDTELNEALTADPDFSAWIVGRTPARRWGGVGDVAKAAVWLCSEEASFVNGQVLYVDGGMTAVI